MKYLVLALGVTLVHAPCEAVESQVPAPMVGSVEEIKLGLIKETAATTVRFDLRNPLDHAVRLVATKTDCGCIREIKVESDTPIPAGGRARLCCGLEIKERQAIHSSLLLTWQDEDQAQYCSRATVSAEIKTPFSLAMPAQRVLFTRGTPGAASFRLTSETESVPKVTATFGRVAPVEKVEDGYIVTVDGITTDHPGFFEGTVTLSSGTLTKDWLFTWGVKQPQVAEIKIVCGIIKRGEPTRAALTLLHMTPNRIGKVSAKDASLEVVNIAKAQSGQDVTLDITLRSNQSGRIGTSICLETISPTGEAQESLEVPISAVSIQ